MRFSAWVRLRLAWSRGLAVSRSASNVIRRLSNRERGWRSRCIAVERPRDGRAETRAALSAGPETTNPDHSRGETPSGGLGCRLARLFLGLPLPRHSTSHPMSDHDTAQGCSSSPGGGAEFNTLEVVAPIMAPAPHRVARVRHVSRDGRLCPVRAEIRSSVERPDASQSVFLLGGEELRWGNFRFD